MPGMQSSAAKATSHRDACPFMYLLRVSARTTRAAMSTMAPRMGPPMMRAMMPRTATTTLQTATMVSQLSTNQSPTSSYHLRF